MRNTLPDAFQSVFLTISFLIVGLALLILINNTDPNLNADLEVPIAENVSVVCELGPKRILEFPATVVWREGQTLHIKHPRSSFVLQDPNHNCSVR